jgi:hypothetical protein
MTMGEYAEATLHVKRWRCAKRLLGTQISRAAIPCFPLGVRAKQHRIGGQAHQQDDASPGGPKEGTTKEKAGTGCEWEKQYRRYDETHGCTIAPTPVRSYGALAPFPGGHARIIPSGPAGNDAVQSFGRMVTACAQVNLPSWTRFALVFEELRHRAWLMRKMRSFE